MIKKIIKSIIAAYLIFVISFSSFAAIVSDSDGAAFVNKREFEELKQNFAKQIDNYSDSIDKKIDGAIASYLYGVRVAAKTELTSLLNKVNDKCNDSYLVGNVETKYNYRCMAKSYTPPTTQKPVGAIVNLFYAVSKINYCNALHESSGNKYCWWSSWHRMALTEASRTGLFDIDIPSSGRVNGKYIMFDKHNDSNKFYPTNRYNDVKYRYYSTGSGVAAWSDGFPPQDTTDDSVTWVFPPFTVSETEYWKIEFGSAAAYWNATGGQTSYDDINVMYGPTYESTESINVIPIVGQIDTTVYGLLKSNLTRMRLQDSSYNWTGYGQSVVTRVDDAGNPSTKKALWLSKKVQPSLSFTFNCHPYESNYNLKDLIDYEATVAYADEEKKTVAIYGGLPVFRAQGAGEVTMKIEFMSDLNHQVYVGLSKQQFANNATYAIDSDLNLRNENDVKYTSNRFDNDTEYTFKMDVQKNDVIWIKTYDASSDTGFTGAKTNGIFLVEE